MPIDRSLKLLLAAIALVGWTALAVFVGVRLQPPTPRPSPEGRELLKVHAELDDVGRLVAGLQKRLDDLELTITLRCPAK